MKLGEVFRFEFAYQARRPWPWLAFAVLVVFAFLNTRIGIVPVTLPQDFVLNSPFIIASVSVFSCLIWLLVSSAMAGEAATRDVQTGMHALVYTSPVGKAEYLGGRLLAAFVLNALVLLGVQVGSLLAAYAPGVDPAFIGPFRPAAYLAAYAFIALPNAFVATTVQFAAALWSGRSLAGYFGSVILLFFTVPVPMLVYIGLKQPDLALLLDPIGMFAIMNEMMSNWTITEKNVRMFTLDGPMLHNRLLWLAIGAATFVVVWLRFRFAHRVVTGLRGRLARRFAPRAPAAEASAPERIAGAVPRARRSFGSAMRVRQTLAIAGSSFWMMAGHPAGLFLLVVFPAFMLLVLVVASHQWGVPLLPRTGYLLTKHVTAMVSHAADFRVLVPLLLVSFAGELVWRERDAGMGEVSDATSVPDRALLVGKLLGLGLLVGVLMVVVAAAGMLAQTLMGYPELQPGLYLRVLFGLQLPEYLLFVALVLVVQVVVDHKQVGLLVALVAYLGLVFAPALGVEHHLLVYGSSPAWSYTDLRGFGPSLGPWVWFKLYWAAWALLLAVVARLLWVRGGDSAAGTRLRLARRRLTRATAGVATLAVGLVLVLGGYIFYNTNVLNEYVSEAASVERRAEYERRYGHFEGIAQPERAGVRLHVELHPDRGSATIQGSYRLVNRSAVVIDSLHLEPASLVQTRVTLDRAATRVLFDERLRHAIYALEEPLRPGDSLTLGFEVRYEPRGFGNGGASMAVVANGTHITGATLPAIGYQPGRELTSPDARRAHGLPRQVTFPAPGDVGAGLMAGRGAVFEAVVGTLEGQVAVAPGELRRTWTDGGRRYFHSASDVPVAGEYFFFSADYAVHRERWNDVEVSVFLHPGHTHNLERLLRSARASLAYYTEQFGPYPQRFLQFVEQPGNFLGMGVDGSGVVTGGEGFFLLNPGEEGLDLVFEVVAHEVAHQWWGAQLQPVPAEGAPLLSESLAWYSAMRVVEEANGADQLRRLRAFMREPYPWPPLRTGLPLLRAMDPWAGYRRGPFAFHALSEYIGDARVNAALRNLLRNRAGPTPSLATTLDLYRELQAVTPDSMQYLLHDLFAANTFWELATERARAEPTSAGSSRVSLDVRARKVVVDTAGVETELPMDDWVEIGVFAEPEPGADVLGRPLYLRRHRIRAGEQTITLTVPARPARAGIDPRFLLIDLAPENNVRSDLGA